MANPLENAPHVPVPFGAGSSKAQHEPKTKARYGEINGVRVHIRVKGKSDNEQRIPRGTKNQIIEDTHDKVIKHVQKLDLRGIDELEVQINAKGELKSFRIIPKGHKYHKNYSRLLDRQRHERQENVDKLSNKLERIQEEKEKLERKKKDLEGKIKDLDLRGKETKGTIHARALFKNQAALETTITSLTAIEVEFQKLDKELKSEKATIEKANQDKANLEEVKQRFNATIPAEPRQIPAAVTRALPQVPSKEKEKEVLQLNIPLSQSGEREIPIRRTGLKEKERVPLTGSASSSRSTPPSTGKSNRPVILSQPIVSTPSSFPRDTPHPPSATASQKGGALRSGITTSQSLEPKLPEKDEKHILHVLNELANTEEIFSDNLFEAVRRLKFMLHPENPDKIPDEKMNSELGRVLKDYTIMAAASKDLESKIRIASMLGDVNTKLRAINAIFDSPFFNFYSKCIKDCVAHTDFLRKETQKVNANTQLLDGLQKYRSPDKRLLDESSLFINPTQRMPRLVLFVDDIKKRVKNLPQEVRVERTLARAKQAANSVNRGQARQEARQYIGELNNRFGDKDSIKPKEYVQELNTLVLIKDSLAIDYDTFFKFMDSKINDDVKVKIKVLNDFFKGLTEQQGSQNPEARAAYQKLIGTLKTSGFIKQLKAQLMEMAKHPATATDVKELMQKVHWLTEQARTA